MKYRKSSREIETIKKKQMQIPDKTISTQDSTASENDHPKVMVNKIHLQIKKKIRICCQWTCTTTYNKFSRLKNVYNVCRCNAFEIHKFSKKDGLYHSAK